MPLLTAMCTHEGLELQIAERPWLPPAAGVFVTVMGRSFTPVVHVHPCHSPQILDRLDVVLPGERGRWWRRTIDGETPHLRLVPGDCFSTYRGPLWTEDRLTSGVAVTARVFLSARGDFLIEMEPRVGNNKCDDHQRVGHCSRWTTGVLRLCVRAQRLRSIFRGEGQHGRMGTGEEDGSTRDKGPCGDWCVSPGRRFEICR